MICCERMLAKEVQQITCTLQLQQVSGKDPQALEPGEVKVGLQGLPMLLQCQQLAGVWTNRSQSSPRAAQA